MFLYDTQFLAIGKQLGHSKKFFKNQFFLKYKFEIGYLDLDIHGKL